MINVELPSEKEIIAKYQPDTPHWQKSTIERYICEKHTEPTIYIRDQDLVVHTTGEDECF